MAPRKKEVNGRWYVVYSDGRLGTTCEAPTHAELAEWAKEDRRPPPVAPPPPPTLAEIAGVILTTGDLAGQKYDVLDCIFAIGAHEDPGFFFRAGVDASKAFDQLKLRLRTECKTIGGDAVLNCQFQYRSAHNAGTPVLELFGYGTAVRFKSTE